MRKVLEKKKKKKRKVFEILEHLSNKKATIKWASTRYFKTCLRGFANNKGTDQPAHMHSLISAFVVRLTESIMSRHSASEI